QEHGWSNHHFPRKETKDMLRKLGSKGQTYDAVIRELIEKASSKTLMHGGTKSWRKRRSSLWMSFELQTGLNGPRDRHLARTQLSHIQNKKGDGPIGPVHETLF